MYRQANVMSTHRYLAVLLGLVLVLAACTGGDATQAPTEGTSSQAPPTGAATEVPTGEATAPPATGDSTPAATDEPAETVSITVAVSQQIFSYSPLYVAQAKGFWEEENLDVELLFFSSGSESQQAVLGDAAMFGAGGYTEPITLTAQGVPAVMFGFIEAALPYQLMAQPEIETVDQLAGKVVAVSRVGALSDQVTRIALNKVGFDPDQVTYQAAGGSPDRFAALQSKAVDATVLDSPTYLLAQDAGYNTLINLAQELEGFPYEVLWAKMETIDANRDVMLRFTRGFIRGATYLRDEANRDEVIPIIAEVLGQDEETVGRGYDNTIEDFPPDGAPQLDGVRAALEGTQQYGDIPNADQVTAEELFYPDLQQEALASLQ